MEPELFSGAGEPDLAGLLKRFFGFESFRLLQEEVMRAALAGHDTFVLMPTGGGKSLCYQLPALAQGGLTIVVSPLIALMKDQVDALQEAGVSATFLNSTLDATESRRRLAGLYKGEYRLLYVAPERLMLPEMLERLAEWRPGLIAIDEAHCISEWGHDFRPEYRQIAELRGRFPKTPVMALTATATERVRKDIVSQLKLRKPGRFVASFNRANLTYRVIPRSQPLRQVLDVTKRHEGESGIVYCASRNGAERLAKRLEGQGIRAVPYHAGLDAGARAKNQEAFIHDEIQIVCATIAFGMGIDKPDVRFVIHHDLPKNIEGYYQETGRAGRDGLLAECVLLFNASDVAKQIGFIKEKTDPNEQAVARHLLQQMVHFAETNDCRRRSLLDYFSEEFTDQNCGACDNCLEPKETFDGTEAAQKFLACLYRIREKSGFGFGLNHVVEVLTGADTEAIRKWGHDQISTHGIGDEFGRDEWKAIGRELMRLGHARLTSGRMSVVELTQKGRDWLRSKESLELTRPIVAKPKSREKRSRSERAGEIECDEMLFERLRELRQELAAKEGVPAYIIFGDVALREMARDCPATIEEFGLISGVGEKKKAKFGKIFISEIAAYIEEKG
ncbi:MAG: DNA helicase RecQ [Verrucomicrobiota bacterium]|jgi:ATP-dependent DNA helicase RecQ|nr:DNA helicase RecQ [Verrucomicrobiota bacterium]